MKLMMQDVISIEEKSNMQVLSVFQFELDIPKYDPLLAFQNTGKS